MATQVSKHAQRTLTRMGNIDDIQMRTQININSNLHVYTHKLEGRWPWAKALPDLAIVDHNFCRRKQCCNTQARRPVRCVLLDLFVMIQVHSTWKFQVYWFHEEYQNFGTSIKSATISSGYGLTLHADLLQAVWVYIVHRYNLLVFTSVRYRPAGVCAMPTRNV